MGFETSLEANEPQVTNITHDKWIMDCEHQLHKNESEK